MGQIGFPVRLNLYDLYDFNDFYDFLFRQKLGNKLIEANLTAFEWPKIIITWESGGRKASSCKLYASSPLTA